MQIDAADIEILAAGDIQTLCRPCVDCSRFTGSYCDHCYAVDRMPNERWAVGQGTPLCTVCDHRYRACHFCRGLHWCAPRPHGVRPIEPPAPPAGLFANDDNSDTDSDEPADGEFRFLYQENVPTQSTGERGR